MNAMLRRKIIVYLVRHSMIIEISVSAKQDTHLGRLVVSFGLGGISHGRFFPDPDLADQIKKVRTGQARCRKLLDM